MGEAGLLLAFITLQRLAELVLARRNTALLRAHGGVEFGRSHYPAMVALHALWLAGLWGLVVLGSAAAALNGALLAVFVALQAARIWVLAALGRRWTTRIMVVPGETLVRRGPYRLLRHPNYVIVAGEIAVVPLALGLPFYALLFSVLNAAMLWVRIRAETAALAWTTAEPDAPMRAASGGADAGKDRADKDGGDKGEGHKGEGEKGEGEKGEGDKGGGHKGEGDKGPADLAEAGTRGAATG